MKRELEITVGIDLGGTGTRIAALGADGSILSHRTVSTSSLGEPGNPEGPVRALAKHVLAVAGATRPLAAVGIGASGPVGADGIIRNDDTLPAFSHFPIAEMLAMALQTRCVIDNDAVAAAIGEHAHGAGRGAASLLVATLGTGIGVCVLNRGKPHRGGDGLHPEAGHLPVAGASALCYCGLTSCWEQKASRTALGRNCLRFPGQSAGPAQASIGRVASLARHGDQAAQGLFHHYGNDIGHGLGTLISIFRVPRVVIGGSVACYFDLFHAGLEETLSRRPAFAVTAALHTAELGDLAGAVGAAEIARRSVP